MRVLCFVILVFFILIGSSGFSNDLNTTSGSGSGISDNKAKLLPEGFMPLTNRVFDDLILRISEDWELDQLLGSNYSSTKEESDWQNWLGSGNNAKSRMLFGGFPFLSMPNNKNEQEPTLFSTNKFIFFWYFKQKF